MIEKVQPNMVPSHHDLAVKVNEIIDQVNRLTATAGGGAPGEAKEPRKVDVQLDTGAGRRGSKARK